MAPHMEGVLIWKLLPMCRNEVQTMEHVRGRRCVDQRALGPGAIRTWRTFAGGRKIVWGAA